MNADFMYQQRKFAKYIISFMLLFTVCRTYHHLESIKKGDYSMVTMGKYQGTMVFLRDAAQYKKVIDEFRGELEQDRHLFPKITRYYYDIPDLLVYKFKFAARDTFMDYFILRYFARIYNHPTLAGYQIQFIFNAGSRRLIDIYTKEVSLE